MSTLLLNTLTGKTSAGSIVVTGEGGSTTTNLQQGVAKAWVNFNGESTAATHYAEIIAINSTATGNYALRTYERTDSLTANDNQTHSTVHGDLA